MVAKWAINSHNYEPIGDVLVGQFPLESFILLFILRPHSLHTNIGSFTFKKKEDYRTFLLQLIDKIDAKMTLVQGRSKNHSF